MNVFFYVIVNRNFNLRDVWFVFCQTIPLFRLLHNLHCITLFHDSLYVWYPKAAIHNVVSVHPTFDGQFGSLLCSVLIVYYLTSQVMICTVTSGGLSHWVQIANAANKDTQYILVDRSSCRYKVFIIICFFLFFKIIRFNVVWLYWTA